jgi:dienelactone hydrolase
VRFEAGHMLEHYRIVEKLGEGGMGEVWLAEDTKLGRPVALKRLPARLASDAQWLERFRREARILAGLSHPGIVTIHAVEESAAGPYLAMELVRGRTLAHEIPAGGLPAARVLELGLTISGAVAAAHDRGIVHRDLKPENIMLGDDGRVRVLDFGLATADVAPAATADPLESPTVAATDVLTQAGTIVGTIAYLSPEQAQGKPADPRSDVFALGIVMYELASGRRPFTGSDQVSLLASILRDSPPPCDRLNLAVPSRLAAIVHRCLEKDPARRFASAAGVHAELQRLHAWARGDGLAELAKIVDRIQGLEEGPEAWQAWRVGREIAMLAPDDTMLQRLAPIYLREISILSEPPGATVLVKYYGAPESEWLSMGTTPLAPVPWPKGFTRVRLEREGMRPMQDVIYNIDWIGSEWRYRLGAPGEWPEDMEWIPGGTSAIFLPGLDHLEPEPLAGFLMDRDPVTNAEFQRFVDAGGYAQPDYWREPVVEGDRTLAHAEAMARFVDSTAQPGPPGWEAGEFPPGEANLPVSGVSWYEAAAYAAWAGKALPTVFHWNRVAFTAGVGQIARFANLHGRALLPVGSTQSMNRFGVRDLAGNVREWTWNASTPTSHHFLLGGGWNDLEYSFTDAWAQSGLDRSATNGFRCIRLVEPEPKLETLQRPLAVPQRDFRSEQPVPDQVFEFFLRQFHYDRTPLAAAIESEQPSPLGRWQTVTFNAAYGGERMCAYVFLPERGKPSYQTVVLFPGSNAIHLRTFNVMDVRRADFLTRSGRAVVLPIYKGTYHRGGELHSDYPAETAFHRDYVIMWAKDLMRTIDYLETRDDLDTSKLAYYGLSWGGYLGAIMPAIDQRIRANVLYVAGLCSQRALPEVEAINYISRVKQPTLMLNAEFDFFFPPETSQKPMFDLLGTPPEHKQRLTWPGGHSVPRPEMIRHTLAWLDRYLGPVG